MHAHPPFFSYSNVYLFKFSYNWKLEFLNIFKDHISITILIYKYKIGWIIYSKKSMVIV